MKEIFITITCYSRHIYGIPSYDINRSGVFIILSQWDLYWTLGVYLNLSYLEWIQWSKIQSMSSDSMIDRYRRSPFFWWRQKSGCKWSWRSWCDWFFDSKIPAHRRSWPWQNVWNIAYNILIKKREVLWFLEDALSALTLCLVGVCGGLVSIKIGPICFMRWLLSSFKGFSGV